MHQASEEKSVHRHRGGRGHPLGGVPHWSSWPPGVCTQSCECSRHVGQECCQPTGMLSAGKGPRVREATEPCNSTNSKINTFRGTSSRKDFTVMPLKARPHPPSRCTGTLTRFTLCSCWAASCSCHSRPKPARMLGGAAQQPRGPEALVLLRPGRGLSVPHSPHEGCH